MGPQITKNKEKNMKKRLLATLLSLCMLVGLLPMTALAANWNPDDEITITVDVFDISANEIYRNVGTDTVTKGNQYIQSNPYKIPELSQFTDEPYGRVQEVRGNWYGYYGSANVGTTVYFSCNSNTARITYWVSYYGEGDTGGGSNGDDTVNTGSGNYSWTQTIVYHSNYPNGIDYTYTVTYYIKNYADIYNYFDVKTPENCGFTVPTGYTLASPPWNTNADGNGTAVDKMFTFKMSDNNKTTHLYAQYNEVQIQPESRYTITYMNDENKVGEDVVVAGESTTIMEAPIQNGSTFLGWATEPNGNVGYQPGESITPTSNMTLYAVWKSESSAPPTAPTHETIALLLGDSFVTVICTNQEINSKHADKSYSLLADSYITGSVTETNGTYTCAITINPEKYVKKYNEEISGHTLVQGESGKTVTLTWDASQKTWTAPADTTGVTFWVVCETPTTYTVIYTDGVEGEIVFENQTTTGLFEGDDTPAFDGTPSRTGYTFQGWNPEVAEKVIAPSEGTTITYTAQWKKNSGGSNHSTTKYTLAYETNGGSQIDSTRHTRNTVVQLTKVPVRENYTFTGWYEDEGLTKKITEIKMTSNKTVYAGWEATQIPGMLNGSDHFAYVIGYPDGNVNPMGNITRAEVATIFFRLLKDDVRDGNLTTTNVFSDVNEGDWFNTAISTMAKLGIVNGRTADTFAPNAPITRAEFAAICARFADTTTSVESTLTDIDGHWAETNIENAVGLGWIMGYEDNTFRPDKPITRAEAMTMINRILCRMPEGPEDLLSGMNIWLDNGDSSKWYYLAIQEATNSHDFKKKNEIYETWTKLTADPDWSRYEK